MASPWVFRAWADADYALASRLKQADVDEVLAAEGVDPLEAIRLSVGLSQRAEAIVVDGRVEGVWGLAEAAPDHGVPWMLSSETLVEDARQLVREGRRIVEECLAIYPVLSNWVDCRNAASLNWLQRIGFAPVELDREYGFGRIPFLRMEAMRHV
jgi:hypothetical protein